MNKSHTCAYAIIAYWCAWLKAHHPVEFAAAALRHEKDDEKVARFLRELDRSGVKIVPIDPARSDADWTVQDGELVGGFKNLVGFGPIKAAAAAEARRNGTMTDKLRAQILAATNRFEELYPLRKQFSGLYSDPESHGISSGTVVREIADLAPDREAVFIGRVLNKKLRDENETLLIHKRGGEVRSGETRFVDLLLTDDSDGMVIARVRPKKFEILGRIAFERLEEEQDVILVRGKRFMSTMVVHVQKMRCLTRPGALE